MRNLWLVSGEGQRFLSAAGQAADVQDIALSRIRFREGGPLRRPEELGLRRRQLFFLSHFATQTIVDRGCDHER
jgi:hypothetical protein